MGSAEKEVSMTARRLFPPLALVVGVVMLAAPVGAATCTVPSAAHPDIQTAVDDIGCAPIVIAAGTFV
jgi:hypothetical protein